MSNHTKNYIFHNKFKGEKTFSTYLTVPKTDKLFLALYLVSSSSFSERDATVVDETTISFCRGSRPG